MIGFVSAALIGWTWFVYHTYFDQRGYRKWSRMWRWMLLAVFYPLAILLAVLVLPVFVWQRVAHRSRVKVEQ